MMNTRSCKVSPSILYVVAHDNGDHTQTSGAVSQSRRKPVSVFIKRNLLCGLPSQWQADLEKSRNRRPGTCQTQAQGRTGKARSGQRGSPGHDVARTNHVIRKPTRPIRPTNPGQQEIRPEEVPSDLEQKLRHPGQEHLPRGSSALAEQGRRYAQQQNQGAKTKSQS